MDFIKEWTICVCVTLVISIIFSTISPNGRLSRFYKIIISMFIFMSFLYPFTTSHFRPSSLKFGDLKIEEESSQLSENLVNTKVNEFLIENDIIGASVSSSVDYNEDVLTINDIQIAVPDEYDTQMVKKLVFDNLSLNARVIHSGE